METLSHLQRGVVNELSAIFPNISQENIKKNVRYHSTIYGSLSQPVLLERCIDDLLEGRFRDDFIDADLHDSDVFINDSTDPIVISSLSDSAGDPVILSLDEPTDKNTLSPKRLELSPVKKSPLKSPRPQKTEAQGSDLPKISTCKKRKRYYSSPTRQPSATFPNPEAASVKTPLRDVTVNLDHDIVHDHPINRIQMKRISDSAWTITDSGNSSYLIDLTKYAGTPNNQPASTAQHISTASFIASASNGTARTSCVASNNGQGVTPKKSQIQHELPNKSNHVRNVQQVLTKSTASEIANNSASSVSSKIATKPANSATVNVTSSGISVSNAINIGTSNNTDEDSDQLSPIEVVIGRQKRTRHLSRTTTANKESNLVFTGNEKFQGNVPISPTATASSNDPADRVLINSASLPQCVRLGDTTGIGGEQVTIESHHVKIAFTRNQNLFLGANSNPLKGATGSSKTSTVANPSAASVGMPIPSRPAVHVSNFVNGPNTPVDSGFSYRYIPPPTFEPGQPPDFVPRTLPSLGPKVPPSFLPKVPPSFLPKEPPLVQPRMSAPFAPLYPAAPNPKNVIDVDLEKMKLPKAPSVKTPDDIWTDAKTAVISMFPDVDPDFLEGYRLRYSLVDPNLVNYICDHMLENGYTNRKVDATSKSSTDTDSAKCASKEEDSVDYYTNYTSAAGSAQYYTQCLHLLKAEFRWMSVVDIDHVVKLFEQRYAPSHRALTSIWVSIVKSAPAAEGQGKANRRFSGFQYEATVKIGTGEKKYKFHLLKSPRHMNDLPYSHLIEELQKELDFLSRKKKEAAEEEDYKLACELNEQMYEETGQLIECGCCFGEFSFDILVQCYEGHLFCENCLQQYAHESVFGHGKADLKCMTDGCDSNFPFSQLEKALPASMLARYQDRVKEESLNLANLGDLVRCPHCEFAALLDPGIKVFSCQNESCRKQTCRFCKEDWKEHFGKKCSEIEKKDETKLRLQYEEKMTQAKLRICHRCKASFTKEDGCNKMTCRCGAKMCYICRKPNIDYNHFCNHPLDPGKKCTKCKNCSLWTKTDEDDERAIAEIQKEAGEKRIAEGYLEEKLIGAPDVPPVKKRK